MSSHKPPYVVVPGPRGSIKTWCPACDHEFNLHVEGARRHPYFRNLADLQKNKEKFWHHVQKSKDPDGCWIWLRGVNSAGYGSVAFNYPRKTLLAHRVSYILFVGEIPRKMNVLHQCDTPLCVRPSHIKAGTQSENMQRRWDRAKGKV